MALLTVMQLQAQDSDNKGWFGNVRAGYTTYTRVTNSQFIPIVGGEDITIDDNTSSNGFNLISGYRFNDYISAGIGIGLDGIKNPDFNTVPLFLDLKFYTSGGDNPLYLYVNAGRHFDPGIRNASFQTGGLVGLGLGYQFFIEKLKFQADLGFHSKNLNIEPAAFEGGSNVISFNGIQLNLAIVIF